MNKVILMGRLTRDPDVRYTDGGTSIARYTLAVDRRFKREGEPTADFINCVVFGKSAEFAEKYFRQGLNKDGVKVYTTDLIVEEQEFAEGKASSGQNSSYQTGSMSAAAAEDGDGFVNIPEGIDEELPFS